jgi:nicotinate-nucleotide adenylyltransferase
MTLESEEKQRSEPTVIFYGGTFDPPHVGHQRLVERTHGLFPRARIWISVSPAPAGAAEQHKAPGASYAQRLDMCRMTFANAILGGFAELTDLEARLPAPNYTVATLQHCEQNFPGETWGLLIGQDQLEQFAAWREPKSILQMTDLLVVSRGSGSNLDDAVKALAGKLKLNLTQVGPDHWRWADWGTSIHLLKGQVSDAASRDVRKDPSFLLKKDWLVPEVASYIQAHGLYRK